MNPAIADAATLTAGLDAILAQGFARLTPDQRASLDELAAAFSGTPLGPTLQQATTALAQGELLAHHLAALAAARESLEGARFDALLAEAAAARHWTVLEPTLLPAQSPDPATTIRMQSAQQWLVELALAGLAQLDNATIVPVIATLEGIQEKPELAGLAAMLTGFAEELLDHAPTSAVAEPPLRRWADLWSRCLLATWVLPEVPTTTPVTGTLFPLGADLRHHDHVASVVVHGLLDHDGGRQLVRTTLTAWKVDAITGPELWGLLQPLAEPLFGALESPHALAIEGMTLFSTGELVWDGSASASTPFDPFTVDLAGVSIAAPAPRHRHPMQLALPVCGAAPADVPVDPDRISPHAGFDKADLSKSTAFVGLLRFDTGWSLQPLSVQVGKKVFGPNIALAAAGKAKSPVLDVLRERASKLLRA